MPPASSTSGGAHGAPAPAMASVCENTFEAGWETPHIAPSTGRHRIVTGTACRTAGESLSLCETGARCRRARIEAGGASAGGRRMRSGRPLWWPRPASHANRWSDE